VTVRTRWLTIGEGGMLSPPPSTAHVLERASASRSPKKGAKTVVWLATSPDVANVSGVYFFEQRPPSPEAQDTETAGRLWEISERQCAVCGQNSEARS
jgi:hypothetical protein